MRYSKTYSFVKCGNCGGSEFKEANIVSVVPQNEKLEPFLISFICRECGTKIYTSFVGGKVLFRNSDGVFAPETFTEVND